VALPDAAHAGGRDRQPLALQRLGDAHLPPGRLLHGESHDRLLDLGGDAVLQYRLAAADLLEREFAALVVEFLEPIEAIPAIAHQLTGLADVAELLGQFQQPDFGADDLLILGHLLVSVPPEGSRGSGPTVRTAPALRLPSETDIACKIISVSQCSLSPPFFRDCAATEIAISAPDQVRLIMPILGHTTLMTSERHYNQAGSLQAGRRYARTIADLRRLSAKHRCTPRP